MTRSLTCVTLALIATFTAACSKQEAPPAAPPPMGVETLTLAEEKLPNVVELPGRIEAVRTAEVRARTNGIVLKRLYKEGTDVRQGAPLFEIDPREYRAQVQQGEAALQRAIATRTNAASVVQRYTPLLSERSVSAQEYDAALADLRQAEAQVAEARAVLDQNKLQLGFTTVRSPIDGRVGRARVTEGALVSGTESTLMTTVNQVTPVYAVFTQSNAAILDIMEKVKAGSVQIDSLQSVKVELTLDNGSPYPLTGQLDFTDQTVDPQTGTQTVRAVFENPDRQLSPGQFVRARIEAGTFSGGMAVPARAVQFQGTQASVAVVGEDDTVAIRPVQLGAQVGSRWIVQSGLKKGERVITEGWQKVRPGQTVSPKDNPSPASEQAPGGR